MSAAAAAAAFIETKYWHAGREIGGLADVEITSCPEPFGLQLYPHPKFCDQFYKCANGTLTLETCSNGLLFDGKGSVHEYCNYYWAADCGERVYERKLTFKPS